MKKIFALLAGLTALLLVVASGFMGYWYFSATKPQEAAYYARYLPRTTLATLSLTHLDELSRDFPQTGLGKLMAKPVMAGIMDDLGTSPRVQMAYAAAYDQIAEVMGNPAVQAVFGDDLALAVLAPDRSGFSQGYKGQGSLAQQPAWLQERRRSLIVIATTAVAGPLDTVIRLSSRFLGEAGGGKGPEISTVQEGKWPIRRIVLDRNPPFYGYNDKGVLLLALWPETIAQALDTREKEQSLHNQKMFLAATQFWHQKEKGENGQKSDGLLPPLRVHERLFINVEQVRSVIEQVMATSPDPSSAWPPDRYTQYLSGLKYLASINYMHAQGMAEEIQVSYVREELNPWLQVLTHPTKNTSTHLVHNDSLFYLWSSCLHLKDLQTVLSSPQNTAAYASLDAFLRQMLSTSLTQEAELLGPQVGLLLNKVSNSMFVPQPKGLFFMELQPPVPGQAQTQAQVKALDRFMENVRAALQELGSERRETVHNQSISTYRIIPGIFSLHLGRSASTLYLGNDKDALLQALQGKQGKQEIQSKEEKFRSALLSQASTGAVLLRPRRIAQQMENATEWFNSLLMTLQGRPLDHLVPQVLNFLRSLEKVSMTMQSNDQRTQIRIFIHSLGAQTVSE